MENQFDTQTALERTRQVAQALRQSDIYPAVIGGIAGGLAGTLMALLIAGRKTAPASAAPEATPAAKGISAREVVQLIPILVALVKQVQGWTHKPNAE